LYNNAEMYINSFNLKLVQDPISTFLVKYKKRQNKFLTNNVVSFLTFYGLSNLPSIYRFTNQTSCFISLMFDSNQCDKIDCHYHQRDFIG